MKQEQKNKVVEFREKYKNIKLNQQLEDLLIKWVDEEQFKENKNNLLDLLTWCAFNVYDEENYLLDDSYNEDQDFIKSLEDLEDPEDHINQVCNYCGTIGDIQEVQNEDGGQIIKCLTCNTKQDN